MHVIIGSVGPRLHGDARRTCLPVEPLISKVVCDQKAMLISTLTVQLVYA
jgi:hypothetical protein